MVFVTFCVTLNTLLLNTCSPHSVLNALYKTQNSKSNVMDHTFLIGNNLVFLNKLITDFWIDNSSSKLINNLIYILYSPLSHNSLHLFKLFITLHCIIVIILFLIFIPRHSCRLPTVVNISILTVRTPDIFVQLQASIGRLDFKETFTFSHIKNFHSLFHIHIDVYDLQKSENSRLLISNFTTVNRMTR